MQFLAIQNKWFLLDYFSSTVAVSLDGLVPVNGLFMRSRKHLVKLFLRTKPGYKVPQLFFMLDIYRH